VTPNRFFPNASDLRGFDSVFEDFALLRRDFAMLSISAEINITSIVPISS